MVSWSNDKELLSGTDVINCEILNKKKKKKKKGVLAIKLLKLFEGWKLVVQSDYH